MPEIRPIGWVATCWPDRWGVPRQPGLVPDAWATLTLAPEVPTQALDGLAGFSHLWLVFGFHRVTDVRWTVRPPRLGGERVGVFASRSPHRPNGLGLSLVGLEAVDGRRLRLRGHDLVDGTPVYDIKPYLPYAEARPDARGGFAADAPAPVPVRWAPGVRASLPADLAELIAQTVAADPRQGRLDWATLRVRVGDRDVHASVDGDGPGLCIDAVVLWEGETR